MADIIVSSTIDSFMQAANAAAARNAIGAAQDLSTIDDSQQIGTDYFGASAKRANRNMIVAMIGDSNTNGRPGWQSAVDNEWKTFGGIFHGAIVYNNGANGSQLSGWVNNITAKVGDARNPANSGTTNPWDVVEGNPDVIIISLGTNDLNTPANQAAGTVSVLRSNLKTLIDFFLVQTNAVIWLRMPQPFHWGENTDAFDYLTQFGSDTVAAECSSRLRTVYNEWANRHPRVLVYDSHKHLFGTSCNDKTVDSQDPLGYGRLIDDGLHPTDLGYRRITQQMAEQWNGKRWVQPTYPSWPSDLLENAVYSETIYVRQLDLANSLMSIDFKPEEWAFGKSAAFNNAGQTISNDQKYWCELYTKLTVHGMLKRLQSMGAGADSIKIFCHKSGNTYSCSSIGYSSTVNTGGEYYITLSVPGVTFVSGDIGSLFTFYVTDPQAMPFRGSREAYDLKCDLSASETVRMLTALPNNRLLEFSYVTGIRQWNGGATEIEFRERNQDDGRYVGGDGTWNNGKPICKLTFGSAGIYTPTWVTWYVENYPSGFYLGGDNSFLSVNVVTGTVSGNLEARLAYRRPTPKPTITTQPSNQSAASGATATFTVVGTQSPTYRWQLKPPAGAWADISGANSASYTTPTLVSGDNGNKYRCILSKLAGGVMTSEATLTVT